MGCCGSKPPNPEVFLKDEQPAPANGYLHDSMPTEGLTMQAWSNFDPGNRYHSQSGALGALQTISVAMDQHGEDSAFYDGSTMADAVGNAGTGPPETLAITAAGAQIATMSMPPHMSFGIASVLRDSAGQVIALIATAQTERPSGFSTSSVNVWGTKPIAGQEPTAVGGTDCYLWARAQRKPMSNSFKFYNAANEQVASGAPISGWAWQYKIMAVGGQGLMLATFTAGSDKKSFDIQCAKGVDVALAICMMAAMQVGHDELRVEPSQGTGDGGFGDD